jgi:methylenetetrahydrofolate reductase (NADPH)
MGIEPIMQMTTRDRNRIALQADLLGASAMGIQNVLCLTGDHPSRGDHPEAKSVFDLDSIQWISAIKEIRDHELLMNGKKIDGNPKFLIGGVANPFSEPHELHIMHLKKKIAAGAGFIQTKPVLDMERFKHWIDQVTEQDLTAQSALIAGVLSLKSVEGAHHLRHNVPGIMIPDTIIERLDAVSEDKQQEEGMKICIEHIEKLKQTKDIMGIHIMAIGCEEKIPEIIERAGLEN